MDMEKQIMDMKAAIVAQAPLFWLLGLIAAILIVKGIVDGTRVAIANYYTSFKVHVIESNKVTTVENNKRRK